MIIDILSYINKEGDIPFIFPLIDLGILQLDNILIAQSNLDVDVVIVIVIRVVIRLLVTTGWFLLLMWGS